MPNSYNGWAASPDAGSIGIDTGFSVLGTRPFGNGGYAGGMKSGAVSTVFKYLITRLHNEVEPMMTEPGTGKLGYGCWGYQYRANVNNTSVLSCHASGTAIDYNAPKHGNGTSTGPNGGGGWSAAQYRKILGILADCGGVIKWLTGNDPMHFEISGSAAQVAAAAARLGGIPAKPDQPTTPTTPTAPTTPTPIPEPEDDDMLKVFRNDKGVDYIYGPTFFRRIETKDEYGFFVARGWIDTPHGSAKVWGQNLIDDTEVQVRRNQLAGLEYAKVTSLVNKQPYTIPQMVGFIDGNAHSAMVQAAAALEQAQRNFNAIMAIAKGEKPADPVPVVPATYTVVAGDSFNAIAQKLNVTPDALAAANPAVTDRGSINIGQVLTVPKS